MDIIGNLWWAWLAGTVICYVVAFANQLRRMKKMVTFDFDDDEGVFGSFTKGLPVLFVSGLLGTGFLIVLALSVIVNVIRWIK